MTEDEEALYLAEEKARGGETDGAKDVLWALLGNFAKRPRHEEPPIDVRRRALELLTAFAPEDVDVACACARILLPDRVDAALGVVRAALRLAPRSIPALRVLAEVQRVAGEWEKALEAYEGLLRACREAIAEGSEGGLTQDEGKRLAEVRRFLKFALMEKAEDHLRPLLVGRTILDSGVHRTAADLGYATNKPPDRGAEHEILSCLLLVAHDDRTGAIAAFKRAQSRYPDEQILRDLPRRVLQPSP